MKQINIDTKEKNQIIDITYKIENFLSQEDIENGYVYIHVPHTTAGITINENADPDVKRDIIKALEIFDRNDYMHDEGNSDAHIKSSLMGANLTVRIENKNMVLGTWQGIMFCEFDGPRNRKVLVDIYKTDQK